MALTLEDVPLARHLQGKYQFGDAADLLKSMGEHIEDAAQRQVWVAPSAYGAIADAMEHFEKHTPEQLRASVKFWPHKNLRLLAMFQDLGAASELLGVPTDLLDEGMRSVAPHHGWSWWHVFGGLIRSGTPPRDVARAMRLPERQAQEYAAAWGEWTAQAPADRDSQFAELVRSGAYPSDAAEAVGRSRKHAARMMRRLKPLDDWTLEQIGELAGRHFGRHGRTKAAVEKLYGIGGDSFGKKLRSVDAQHWSKDGRGFQEGTRRVDAQHWDDQGGESVSQEDGYPAQAEVINGLAAESA